MARAAKGTGVRVLHNIFAAVEGMDAMVDADLAWLDSLRAEGLDIVGSTILHAGWIEAGIRSLDTAAGQMAAIRRIVACADDEAVRALLADTEFVREFSTEYETAGPRDGASGFTGQTVIEVGNDTALRPYLDRRLDEIAPDEDRAIIEVLCDIALRSNLPLRIKSLPFTATDARLGARLLSHPAVAGGVSDGGAHTKALSSGSYATEMLIRMVREQKAMTIETMHHQLSLKIARALNIPDRGAILPGFWADILIYSPDSLYFDRGKHCVVHDMPGGDWRLLIDSGGYDRILLNGETTWLGGRDTGARPGVFVGAV